MSMSESSGKGIGIGDEHLEGELSEVSLSQVETFFCGVCCAKKPEEKKAEYSCLSVV